MIPQNIFMLVKIVLPTKQSIKVSFQAWWPHILDQHYIQPKTKFVIHRLWYNQMGRTSIPPQSCSWLVGFSDLCIPEYEKYFKVNNNCANKQKSISFLRVPWRSQIFGQHYLRHANNNYKHKMFASCCALFSCTKN